MQHLLITAVVESGQLDLPGIVESYSGKFTNYLFTKNRKRNVHFLSD